ncbi:hypothetical protein [Iodobacter ciconiae]|uniref:Uncharacterized protein n=1 Tax=Iodobacter ciconiae TaxID=2496266 RepID=A0A3S8ZP62_9NEIS|nr:hypothetical protein [Iodobacter ciconiae]AZN35250.1 hypothetical protein EJO50_01345 [Iodobacter ciconiae]
MNTKISKKIIMALFFILLVTMAFLIGTNKIMNKEPSGISIQSPMLIESPEEGAYYLLPKNTTLYFKKSMPEGYSQYALYLNYKGPEIQGEKTEGISPTWIYSPEKEDVTDLIKKYPLTKEQLKSLLKINQFTKNELIEIINSL